MLRKFNCNSFVILVITSIIFIPKNNCFQTKNEIFYYKKFYYIFNFSIIIYINSLKRTNSRRVDTLWKGNGHRLEQYRRTHVVGVFSGGALATVCILYRSDQHVRLR